MQQYFIQFFLNTYFRDINSTAFDKYGLSKFITAYSQANDKNDRPAVPRANNITLLSFGVFTDIMIALGVYMLSVLIGIGNITFFVVPVVVAYIITGVMWKKLLLKKIASFQSEAQGVIEKYDLDHPAIKNAKAKNAT